MFANVPTASRGERMLAFLPEAQHWPAGHHQGRKQMKTKTFKLTAAAAAIALCAPVAAVAGMSTADYQAAKKSIEADYKAAKATCAPMASHAKDICLADAKGKEKVGLAELMVTYKPSDKTRYEALVVRADADFAVAKEKCDEKAGNPKDVCVKEAHAARTTAKADAKAHVKVVEAGKSKP
jgi:hypothetical protein